MTSQYQLIDSGDMQKLEQFGKFLISRPCPQALWRPSYTEEWKRADAAFSRAPKNTWQFTRKLPASWIMEASGVTFKIAPTDFGHMGFFPEHVRLWSSLQSYVRKDTRILNLFAYSGGATLAFAQKGAKVCHVDASMPVVEWARENARLNTLDNAPIRWIVDDVTKFLKREIKRGSRYEGILLDPPTFGRGAKGEVFKLERDLIPLLEACHALLSEERLFLAISCHTPGITPLVLRQVMDQLTGGRIEADEMLIASATSLSIPSGCYAITHYV